MCSLSNLSSGELASWTQAIIASVAIVATGGLALWQAKAQYRGARQIQLNDEVSGRRRTAAALRVLADAAANAMGLVTISLSTRDQVGDAAERRTFVDLGELATLSRAFSSIPLHELPSADLLRLTLIAGSILRQYKELVEHALVQYREMAGNDYTTFFNSMHGLTGAMEGTAADFETALAGLPSPG
jgi:hypothetical protein